MSMPWIFCAASWITIPGLFEAVWVQKSQHFHTWRVGFRCAFWLGPQPAENRAASPCQSPNLPTSKREDLGNLESPFSPPLMPVEADLSLFRSWGSQKIFESTAGWWLNKPVEKYEIAKIKKLKIIPKSTTQTTQSQIPCLFKVWNHNHTVQASSGFTHLLGGIQVTPGCK